MLNNALLPITFIVLNLLGKYFCYLVTSLKNLFKFVSIFQYIVIIYHMISFLLALVISLEKDRGQALQYSFINHGNDPHVNAVQTLCVIDGFDVSCPSEATQTFDSMDKFENAVKELTDSNFNMILITKKRFNISLITGKDVTIKYYRNFVPCFLADATKLSVADNLLIFDRTTKIHGNSFDIMFTQDVTISEDSGLNDELPNVDFSTINENIILLFRDTYSGPYSNGFKIKTKCELSIDHANVPIIEIESVIIKDFNTYRNINKNVVIKDDLTFSTFLVQTLLIEEDRFCINNFDDCIFNTSAKKFYFQTDCKEFTMNSYYHKKKSLYAINLNGPTKIQCDHYFNDYDISSVRINNPAPTLITYSQTQAPEIICTDGQCSKIKSHVLDSDSILVEKYGKNDRIDPSIIPLVLMFWKRQVRNFLFDTSYSSSVEIDAGLFDQDMICNFTNLDYRTNVNITIKGGLFSSVSLELANIFFSINDTSDSILRLKTLKMENVELLGNTFSIIATNLISDLLSLRLITSYEAENVNIISGVIESVTYADDSVSLVSIYDPIPQDFTIRLKYIKEVSITYTGGMTDIKVAPGTTMLPPFVKLEFTVTFYRCYLRIDKSFDQLSNPDALVVNVLSTDLFVTKESKNLPTFKSDYKITFKHGPGYYNVLIAAICGSIGGIIVIIIIVVVIVKCRKKKNSSSSFKNGEVEI